MTKCSYNDNRFLKRTVALERAVVFHLQDVELKHSYEKEKNPHVYFFPRLYMLWSFRFGSRNLKDAKFFMFLWCITTSGLTTHSLNNMTFSRFSSVNIWFICPVNDCLLLTTISYAQENFELNNREESQIQQFPDITGFQVFKILEGCKTI